MRIIITKPDIVINSKSEFRKDPIIRVVPTTSLQGEQEGSRSFPWGRGEARSLARGRSYRRTQGGRRETRLPA